MRFIDLCLLIQFSLLTITLYFSVRKTLVYNNTKYSVPLMTFYPSSTVILELLTEAKKKKLKLDRKMRKGLTVIYG
jgi:hypothetical protein